MRAQVSREKTPGVEGAALPWEEGLGGMWVQGGPCARHQVPETMGSKHRREQRQPRDPCPPSPSVVTELPLSSWAPGAQTKDTLPGSLQHPQPVTPCKSGMGQSDGHHTLVVALKRRGCTPHPCLSPRVETNTRLGLSGSNQEGAAWPQALE